MRASCLKTLGLIISALLVASCAPVTLVNIWHNQEAPARKFHKLLVVSIAPDTVARQLFEAVIVAELVQHGVAAVPGSSMIQGSETPNRQNVEKGVKESGSDGIISLQLDRVAKQTTVLPAYTITYAMGWYPDAFSSWNFYTYYDTTTYYVPPTVITDEKWMIRATFFDAGNGKLLWAGTFKTVRPDQYIAVGQDVARTVVKNLASDGLI